MDVNIRSLSSLSKFKKALLDSARTDGNSLFDIHDPTGVKLLNRLRLNFGHLNEHKFRHGFRDTLNLLCDCNSEVETTSHYLLRCHLFSNHRLKLLDNINQIDDAILTLSDKEIPQILLYGSLNYSFFILCSIFRTAFVCLNMMGPVLVTVFILCSCYLYRQKEYCLFFNFPNFVFQFFLFNLQTQYAIFTIFLLT